MAAQAWTPYDKLTTPPTNFKEAIDWVLRVTGRDGKENDKSAATKPEKPDQFSCLCFLAKAVKDLLYDAKDPGSPGPSTHRYWDDLLLDQERDIVKPVLTDLGLLSGSTSAASSTCAGGTEVIGALIDQLAGGLQKWVGWKDGEKGKDVCCLNTETGIGKKCTCPGGVGATCCTGVPSTPCHDCDKCGTSATASGAGQKCYLSAYCKPTAQPSGDSYWPILSDKPLDVHLLARIFLGSVCLIWSGLSQLGFLTKEGSGGNRWSQDGTLSEVGKGLGSFMAAMGYDLDRLNGSGTGDKTGQFVNGLLTGNGGKDKGVPWQEFKNGDANKGSVAEYYSSIYEKAKEAGKGSTTEKLCQDYPLLVLHILASGYFRAGSAGAKGITSPAKPGSSPTSATPSSRKPRTIREILYWLSALPYSQGYCGLVRRMDGKMKDILPKQEQEKGELKLHGEGVANNASTTLKRDCVTHYLMAACGYCPLVLIGIQGTINTSGTDSDSATPSSSGSAAGSADQKKCPEHSKDRNKRCTLEDAAKAAPQAPAPAAASTGKPLEKGQVCYGGYHLEVSSFGPLHGMYANGLYGFDLGGSPAQCLDQLRVYVYHCFYQLYFLRKQCSAVAVLGWQSCRYGKDVKLSSGTWLCSVGTPGGTDCQCKKSAGHSSPLMAFLCDELKNMHCPTTYGSTNNERNPYPNVEDHVENKKTVAPGHFGEPPKHCPVPMGWQIPSSSKSSGENHFKDLSKTHKQEDLQNPAAGGGAQKYPAHCTGNTLSHLLEYYCDPEKCHGTLVVLLRLLACITPTVPRTLGDLFGFYYYIVYIGGKSGGAGQGEGVHEELKGLETEVLLYMGKDNEVVGALTTWSNGGDCQKGTTGSLKCLIGCSSCAKYLSPLSGQQYGQLSPAMAGTYLSWLVYLIGEFKTGLSQPWYCLLHYPFQVLTQQVPDETD